MIYLLFVVIAVLTVCAVVFVGAQKGVIDTGEKLNIYKKCEDDITPFKETALILITTICFALALVIQISLYKNTSVVSFIKLYGVFVIVLCAAVVDFKRKIIPNVLIICGLVFRAVIYIYEFFFLDNIKQIFTNDLIGFAIGFVFLGLVSFLTKGSLGFGDAKLFGIIGITSGAFCTYSTLFASLIISAVVSLISLARRKMGRKDTFPFGPCITAGYIITLLLTSY